MPTAGRRKTVLTAWCGLVAKERRQPRPESSAGSLRAVVSVRTAGAVRKVVSCMRGVLFRQAPVVMVRREVMQGVRKAGPSGSVRARFAQLSGVIVK